MKREIHKGFKFRLYPTPEQKAAFLQCGGNERFLWNYFLKLNQDYYKETGKFKFRFELQGLLPELKKEYLFLKDSYASSLQVVCLNFDRALKDSFKKKKGFPKFKKKNLLNDSFNYPQGWKLAKDFVSIPKIGKVKWVKHRELQGEPKSIIVSQDGEKWYCSVMCKREISGNEKIGNNFVGCDVGIKEFATLSDGSVIKNPKHIKKYEKKLSKEQRKLNKKKKGSKNRFKQRLKVRKIQNKIRDTRKDFLHKASYSIVKDYDGIAVEDLNIKGMMKNKHLSKAIADVSWFEFNKQLEYKSLWNFKHYVKIDRFEPSSKVCSRCGNVQAMPLHKRTFKCSDCGFAINRDLNAAINIRNIGLNTLGYSEINACGDGSIEPSLKQEKHIMFNTTL